MAKATHTGTCQVCGATQKLPGCRLSTHGYKVIWNRFNGQCPGTGALPFELDKNLVEDSIRWAEEDVANLTRRAAELKADTNPTQIRFKVYTYIGRQRVGQWVTVNTADDLQPDWYIGGLWDLGGKLGKERAQHAWYGGFGETEAANKYHAFNLAEARTLEHEAKQTQAYADQQKRRIEGWKPRPEALQPVVER